VEGTGFGTITSTSDLRLTLAGSVTGTAGINGGTLTNPQINRTALSLANLNNTFFVGSTNIATLPIRLLSFDARAQDGIVYLDWSTGEEINNDHFTIKRSPDALVWTDLQTIPGSGTTNTITHYRAQDPNPLAGTSFYRIRQTDYDGAFWISMVRSVSLNAVKGLRIFPNPATDYVQIESGSSLPLSVRVYDPSGQWINLPQRYENNQCTLMVSGLAAGTYFLQIYQGGRNETHTLIIGK
jgi:hypothetical protein